MARLVFGMNQSLDGYVDHTEFAPGPTLFRHFVEQAHSHTIRRPCSGRCSLPEDASNGYEAVAEEFMAVRSTAGRAVVKKWAASLPRACSVVDVGAGHGEPLTSVLIAERHTVFAIDASQKMVDALQCRFPDVEVACEPAEHSRFFDRTFDAALAIGLIFLLPENSQRELIRRISDALNPEGRLLLSAPREVGEWNDILTGRTSWSLGSDEYRNILADSGLRLIDEYDELDAPGSTHFYEAQKG